MVSAGAMISILNRELPPCEIEAGANDFAPVTSLPRIVTPAFAAFEFIAPSAVVTVRAGMVFVNALDKVPAGAVT